MCGRFTLSADKEKISDHFSVNLPIEFSSKYNIFPGQNILILKQEADNVLEFSYAHWGFIPHWQKEEKISSQWINARFETVDEKPLFKSAFKQHRCLIIADGFYEWTKEKVKRPYYFHINNNSIFGFAGLLSYWENKEGKVIESCVILTTSANEIVKPVHLRMPIILSSEYFDEWLSPKTIDKNHIKTLNENLITYPVSAYVNSPLHQSKKCIEAIL